MRTKRYLLVALALLVCSRAAAADDPIRIELFTTSGRDISGVLLSQKGPQCRIETTVKGRKRLVYAYPINFIRHKLTFSAADAKTVGDDDFKAGQLLMARKLPYFAEQRFLAGLKADPDLADRIKLVYETAGATLPESLGGKPDPRAAKARWTLARERYVKRNLATAAEWGKKMAAISKRTHRIETDFFIIYSDWSPSDDRMLKTVYANLYRMLCKEFVIAPYANIWIGKLPVYACWTKSTFAKFATEVCGYRGDIERTGGFAGRRGPYQYVVLGPVQREGMSKGRAKTWFAELLVHESTHAFISRYGTDRHLVSWLNEGLAETMAARLVPGCGADRSLRGLHRHLRKGLPPDVMILFGPKVPLEDVYYGMAQSITRYLIKLNHKKYIQLITTIKQGKSDKDALQEVYGADHPKLLKSWYRAIGGGRKRG